MQISVFCENNTEFPSCISSNDLQDFAEKLFSFAFKKIDADGFLSEYNYEFELLLTDNAFIHSINKEYRKKDMPTDVITFALYADSENKFVLDNSVQLGQIIISLDKVKEQSLENNITEQKELLNLLSHGILHLLGLDHPDENSLVYMLELQEKMIESVANVKI